VASHSALGSKPSARVDGITRVALTSSVIKKVGRLESVSGRVAEERAVHIQGFSGGERTGRFRIAVATIKHSFRSSTFECLLRALLSCRFGASIPEQSIFLPSELGLLVKHTRCFTCDQGRRR
jgi:hypothetical protein